MYAFCIHACVCTLYFTCAIVFYSTSHFSIMPWTWLSSKYTMIISLVYNFYRFHYWSDLYFVIVYIYTVSRLPRWWIWIPIWLINSYFSPNKVSSFLLSISPKIVHAVFSFFYMSFMYREYALKTPKVPFLLLWSISLIF